jgi:hypothetical protein
MLWCATQVFDNFSYMFCMVPVLYCIYYSLRQDAHSLKLYCLITDCFVLMHEHAVSIVDISYPLIAGGSMQTCRWCLSQYTCR